MITHNDKGFSLIEVVATIGILAIVVAGGAVVMGQLHGSLTSKRRSEELRLSIQEFKEWIENPIFCKELITPLISQSWKPVYPNTLKLNSVTVSNQFRPVGYTSPQSTYGISEYTVMANSTPTPSQKYVNIEFIINYWTKENGKKKEFSQLFFLPVELNSQGKIIDCYDYKKLIFNEIRADLCDSVYGGEFDEEINNNCNIIASEALTTATCLAFGYIPDKGRCVP